MLTMAFLLAQLASDAVLTQAYRWLCDTRAHDHHNDEVWHVRHWWARQTVERWAEKVSRLYKHGAAASRIGDLRAALGSLGAGRIGGEPGGTGQGLLVTPRHDSIQWRSPIRDADGEK